MGEGRLSNEEHGLFRSLPEGAALFEIARDPSGTPLDYIFLDVNPAYERRVLVIEDERDIREGLQAAMQVDDHQVEIACTGAEGIEKARQFNPDVVFCDIGLSGMSGHDVARAFRVDPALRSAFLVALSGNAQASDLDRSRAAGFDRHLAKPMTIPEIQEAIAAASGLRDP